MDERKPFFPRREMRVGNVFVDVAVTNFIERTHQMTFVVGEACSSVWIQIAGFRPIPDEVVFMDMKPGPRGAYEPLLGYTVLERSGLVIDMVTHRLVARKYFNAKLVAHAAG